jgi:zinc transport system substrate-binding protein
MKMIVMRYVAAPRARLALPRLALPRLALAAVLAIGTVAGLAGCDVATGQGAADGRPSVVTGLYPYQFLAQRIGAPRVTVTNLTPPGGEPHDLELTPRQVGVLAAADLVIYQKGFQPAVDRAVAQNHPGRVLEVGAHLASPSAAVTAADPHGWLDPDRFARVAGAVAAALATMDPPHAADYRSRAASLQEQLRDLDRQFRAGLAACRSRVIVTNHEAFGHLAARYGLRQIPISGLAPDSEPSPERLRAVAEAVRDHHVTTIFFETLASPKAAQTLADDVGVATAVLDPLEGLADPAAGDYLTVMRANLDALRTALGCT